MSLKSATKAAIVGQSISLLWSISLNLGLISWDRMIALFMNIIGSGSILLFLITLYSKQKN